MKNAWLQGALVVVFASLIAACSDSSDDSSNGNDDATCVGPECANPSAGRICEGRSGGAYIKFEEPDVDETVDQLWLWITNNAFIDEALQHAEDQTWRVAMFGEVIASADCDEAHPWHVDPVQADWADMSTEECDANITYVTANLSDWVARPTPNWCPWMGLVRAVVDAR